MGQMVSTGCCRSMSRLCRKESFLGFGIEPVADSPDSHDLVAERTQLLPQARHVRVDGAVEAVEVGAPDALDEKFATERPSRIGHEHGQELELLAGQVH